MNHKLIEALNFLNTLSEEDIKNQFENVEYDNNFFISVNYYDEFLVDLKTNYLYSNENDILSNLDGYSIAA